jgi:hypothetical protein
VIIPNLYTSGESVCAQVSPLCVFVTSGDCHVRGLVGWILSIRLLLSAGSNGAGFHGAE